MAGSWERLTANGNGQWSKKIRGKIYYFGTWSDPDAALKRYLEVKDDLHAGRKPRSKDGFTVKDLCNHFLTTKQHLRENGEITNRTFIDYNRTTDKIVDHFGKSQLVEDLAPEDFISYRRKLSKTMGPVGLGNEIQRARTVFGYAWKECLIDKPVRMVPDCIGTVAEQAVSELKDGDCIAGRK